MSIFLSGHENYSKLLFLAIYPVETLKVESKWPPYAKRITHLYNPDKVDE